jgi:hypothetical protein
MRKNTKRFWPVVSQVILFASLTPLCLFSPPAGAAPEPALVPPPGTWQLDLELHGEPHQICITLPGDTQPRRFWYFLYTIANNTGQDIDFIPQFELYTDTFQLRPAGVKVRRPVFDAIRDRYRDSIPLLEPQSMLTGKVLQNVDNARDSVAIFEDFDPNATSVKIFIAGLSNETVTIVSPAASADNSKEFLLRKTLMLEYQVPGDRFNLDKRVMLYRNREWIMR